MQQHFQQQLQRTQQMCSNAANLVQQIAQELQQLQQLQQLSAPSYSSPQAGIQQTYGGGAAVQHAQHAQQQWYGAPASRATMQSSFGAAGGQYAQPSGQLSGQQPYGAGASVNSGMLSAVMNADRMDNSDNTPSYRNYNVQTPTYSPAQSTNYATQVQPENIQAVMRADQFADGGAPRNQAAGSSWSGAGQAYGSTGQAYGNASQAYGSTGQAYGSTGMSAGSGSGAGFSAASAAGAGYGASGGALQAVMSADRAAPIF